MSFDVEIYNDYLDNKYNDIQVYLDFTIEDYDQNTFTGGNQGNSYYIYNYYFDTLSNIFSVPLPKIYISINDNGNNEFYFNNSKKFETLAVGVKATGNVDVTANVGIAGNAVIGTYMSIANTNPAATDALVIGGNVRIASGSLIFADGTSQSSGSTTSTFPTGDYGLLDASNVSTDSFGQTTGGLTQFDMLTSPTGSVDGQDLGALS